MKRHFDRDLDATLGVLQAYDFIWPTILNFLAVIDRAIARKDISDFQRHAISLQAVLACRPVIRTNEEIGRT